ncbi:MAG: hypothetical protein RIM99_04685 [Cyclobacteriaceae bacterium]
MLINHHVQTGLFTDEIYRDTFGSLAGEERLEEFLQNRNDGQLQSAIFSVLQIVSKLTVFTIAILIGFALFRTKVRFADVFKSILIAEFVMLFPSIIRLVWFNNYEHLIVIGDYKAFAPWSVHYYLSNYDVPIPLLNISVFVNVFEFLFLVIVI